MAFSDNAVINLKIVDINYQSWGIRHITVAPRNFHALVYRLTGSAKLTSGDTTVFPNRDTVTFMPAFKAYAADYDEPNDIIHIHFEADINEPPEVFNLSSPEMFKSLFERAQAAWADKTGAYYYNAAALVYEILGKLSVANEKHDTDTHKSFLSAVAYMHEHFTDPELSVDTLVELSHMSNTYFRKLFELKFDTTPSKYLTDLRTKYAERLLSTGNFNVSEAAAKSGFYDPKYFCRVIKRKFGLPPSRLFVSKN